jgi:potassium-dependent mechanosensitive channel
VDTYWLVEGFSLGTITIVPTRIGVGFLIFALGWSGISLVKDKIIRTWLAESEIAPSVQDALSTVLGYLGYSLVILFGLSTAGISFSGLAIVAGALSVGIGFGLQNIVNNLVSGLILLVERPIKRGDWVVVGTTEGYVKKISVRSTIIQTFDRSDVIVPNSELISNQVTNMMLQDTRGRVRVAVGVAYGSDTGLVKEILLGVAKKHPEVINNGSAPYPVVRFQAFGESSLDFELFCHLKDVDKRIDVRSDLNFSIDNAFRKHGVEIPFAQRDLHIKSGLHMERKSGSTA